MFRRLWEAEKAAWTAWRATLWPKPLPTPLAQPEPQEPVLQVVITEPAPNYVGRFRVVTEAGDFAGDGATVSAEINRLRAAGIKGALFLDSKPVKEF